MKNYYALLLLVFLFVTARPAAAQNAYYDALKLRSYMTPDGSQFKGNAKDYINAILGNARYVGAGGNPATAYAANPFINHYLPIPPPPENGSNTEAFLGTPPTAGTSPLSALGNLNVANLADGIAQFLIERGKEELDIAFIGRFQDFLKNYPEAQIAFPTTIGFISNIQSYNYAAMMPALKAAFQKDLGSLSTNLLGLRNITSNPAYLAAKTDSNPTKQQKALITRANDIAKFVTTVPGRAVIGALIISDGIARGTNPATVIDNVAQDPAFNRSATSGGPQDILGNSIQLIDLLSQSLRSTDEGAIWISKDQVAALVKDVPTFKLYLGLLLAQDQSQYKIQFGTADVGKLEAFLTNLYNNWDTTIDKFKSDFSTLASAASQASDDVKEILKIKVQNDQSGLILCADYATSISTFLKSAVNLVPDNLVSPAVNASRQDNSRADPLLAEARAIKTDIGNFTSVIDNLINSYYYIKSKNYSALILSTSSIFTSVANSGIFNDADNKMFLSLKNDYIKYGTFMASILEAKSGADVKAAIEAVALPAGSYSIKQNSAFNVSFNGYVGYGWDIHAGQGITAPMGFSFTRGMKDGQGFPPVTVFVGIIDVGALVSYRSNDTTTNSLKQQVTLESIIAPSAQVFIEIPKWPVAIGAGWRSTPKLSYSRHDNTFVTIPSKSVFNISVLIDIPIFTLHNASY